MSQRTYNTEFGNSVSNSLTETGRSQRDLAISAGLTPPHLNQFMTGHKKVPPKWCDVIAHALDMKEKQRRELHRAAARDAGYDLDLTNEHN